jgi:flagellar motor switch protein FliM
MSTNLKRNANRNFLPPNEGSRFPVFDLTGQQQRIYELHQSLNGLNEPLMKRLTRDLGKLLSHDTLEVLCPDWHQSAPEDAEFWLSAFTPDQPHQPVLLGLDRRSLFGLSELFFGGRPEKLADKHLESRVMADTERRLGNRLLNLILNAICPDMDLPLADWQSTWLDVYAENPGSTFWCPIKVSTGNCSLTMHCGWPVGKTKKPVERAHDEAEVFSGRIRQSLRCMPTTLRVEVATLTLTLQDVTELKAGDILPLDLGREVKAHSGSSECLRGLICEHEDQLALRVTNIVGDKR